MRIALLTDIHANLPALTAVLAAIQPRGCERIYHAGDLIGIGPYPAEGVDLAMSSGMRCVLGLFEGVVTGAADGYWRIARKPACTLLHLGPGLIQMFLNR